MWGWVTLRDSREPIWCVERGPAGHSYADGSAHEYGDADSYSYSDIRSDGFVHTCHHANPHGYTDTIAHI